jgi:hypothetical protein
LGGRDNLRESREQTRQLSQISLIRSIGRITRQCLAPSNHLEPRDKRCFWRRSTESCPSPSSMAILQARPTLRDIGHKTGFHYSTVSLALRDHPRIPDSTKQIIREAAKGLGYQPDAMLSALCAYRLTKRMPKGQTVIAWITNHQTRTGWKMSACTQDYFEAASQRATERGYQLEIFWLSEPGMTGERMSRILWTRGIQGVLLPPQEHFDQDRPSLG